MRILTCLAVLSTLVPAPSLFAWGYNEHRSVNLIALSSLPTDFPAFVQEPSARERIGFLAGEPDRWRNSTVPSLRHVNSPDHFFDIEDIEPQGMQFSALPEFRYVFVADLAVLRHAHPELFPQIDPAKNTDRTGELPGFLPWAIMENYGKLKSTFSYLKAYEEHGGTADEIANARANIIYIMGVMGHYVGDAAQPLHTTKHFNGWVGENPKGYTTARTIHGWIDDGFINRTDGLDEAALIRAAKPASVLSMTPDGSGRDPVFVQTLNYILSQLPKVEQLYALEKAGKLDPAKSEAKEGRAFLEGQILIGAKMLSDLWLTAWKEAPADTFLISSLEQRQTQSVK